MPRSDLGHFFITEDHLDNNLLIQALYNVVRRPFLFGKN